MIRIRIRYIRHYEPGRSAPLWRCAAYYQNEKCAEDEACLILIGRGNTRHEAFMNLKAGTMVELDKANRKATAEDLTIEAEEKKA
jgi:hypothetical protein